PRPSPSTGPARGRGADAPGARDRPHQPDRRRGALLVRPGTRPRVPRIDPARPRPGGAGTSCPPRRPETPARDRVIGPRGAPRPTEQQRPGGVSRALRREGFMATVTAPRPESPPAPPLRTHRFTVAQYEKMIQAGVFVGDERVELLEGWIVDKMPRNPPH